MRNKAYALSICLLIVVVGICNADTKEAPLSIEQAIQIAGEPAGGFASMSPFELQTHYRLMWLLYRADYKYEADHADAWLQCMRDKKQNLYARLCAAYFLLDHNEEARKFVLSQLKSKNLRHRYNAAEVVEIHVGRDPKKGWGVRVLIGLLADGSIDGSGVTSSPPGNYPQWDRDDIMTTPIDDICWSIGFMKEKKAVPALISVLERSQPARGGAAFALGEIGDERAIPVLMKLLKDRSTGDEEDRLVIALGHLRCRDAVPILVSRLGKPRTTFSGLDRSETRNLLEALLAIGDRRAIEPIKTYLHGEYPQESKAVARRVLLQLSSDDPVEGLFTLLIKETYEPERSNIIHDLVRHSDSRVVKRLSNIARTSDSAFMRRQALCGLSSIGDRQSLLVLASLLDTAWPEDLRAEWGWRVAPDFGEFFPNTIVEYLKEASKQDFGRDKAKWDAWIRAHVEQSSRHVPK